MRRRDLFLALPFLALASAAGAEEHAATAGQNVDLAPVAIPIVADGRVVNYVFLNIRINLTPTANITALRAHEPYFRDALIRAAHRTPFSRTDDFNTVDQPRLKAFLLQQIVAFGGPRAVQSIVVVTETPRRRLPSPRPASAAPRPPVG